MANLSLLTIPSQGNFINLCWAAATIGIGRCLNGQVRSFKDIASACLVLCNGDMDSPFCDATFSLSDALNTFNYPAASAGGALEFSKVSHIIHDRQRPLGIMLDLPSGNHYCVIKDCYVTQNEISLLDPHQPIPTPTIIQFDALRDGSVLGGPWVDSILLI